MLKGKLHQKQIKSWNWACFERYLKIINIFLENDLIILKQIVWEIQKWHQGCIRHSSSWVTNHPGINQNHVRYCFDR